MKLYHGSYLEVINPKILEKHRPLDFGGGFYLTSSEKQASDWAKLVTLRRRNAEAPVLNIYDFQEENMNSLEVLHFELADEDWLEFVVANRKGIPLSKQYDLIIGAVADDATLPVINDYMDGKLDKSEALKRLLPQKLTDQYNFVTQKALNLLEFERSNKL